MNSAKKILPRALTVCGLVFLFKCPVAPAAAETPGQPTGQQKWEISRDLQVTALQPGLWLHTSWHTYADGSRYPANGLIVEEQDHLVLIDTAWGEKPTADLLAWIKQELHRPVTLAIITHAHDDRMGGAPVLVREHIRFVAHAKTLALAEKHGWPKPESIGDLLPGETLRLGSLEIFFPGAGHTSDNIMVWIPASRVLFGGCAVKAAEAPGLGNTEDADLAAWPESIHRTQQKYGEAKMVVPGHGGVGGPELLTHTLMLLAKPK